MLVLWGASPAMICMSRNEEGIQAFIPHPFDMRAGIQLLDGYQADAVLRDQGRSCSAVLQRLYVSSGAC